MGEGSPELWPPAMPPGLGDFRGGELLTVLEGLIAARLANGSCRAASLARLHSAR